MINLVRKLFLVFICSLIMVSGTVHATESVGSTTTKTFTTTTTEFPNPERGWYRGLSNTGPSYFFINDGDAGVIASNYASGSRVLIGVLGLGAYATTATLPTSFLSMLSGKFALLRTGGVKVILRIAYNYDQSNLDATLPIAQGHLTQLGPLLKANADVIAFAQAGMIGNFGEWWYGSGGSLCPGLTASCRQAVLTALGNAYDPRTTIGVRYIRYVVSQYPSIVDQSVKFSGSLQSRLGYHNDCFMSSDNDVGTFSSSTLGLGNPERLRLSQDSSYVPFGGETCSGFSPTRLGCDTGSGILKDGPDYHLAYLNRNFYTAFHDSWTSGGCFAQVERSIGYRFQLDSIVHQGTAVAGQSITATVLMRNQGWSRIFSARRLNLQLRNTSTGATIICIGDQDLRSLNPQATGSTTLKIGCTIPGSTAAGTYDAYLAIPDVWATTSNDPRYSVRFANLDNSGNAQAWDATNGRFKVGTQLTVTAP